MSSAVTTFVDACIRGIASLSDIDDWVDRWHDTDFQGEAPSLFEYLGFTPDEGKLWVENSSGSPPAANHRCWRRHQVQGYSLTSSNSSLVWPFPGPSRAAAGAFT
jgi:hypothetical protein